MKKSNTTTFKIVSSFVFLLFIVSGCLPEEVISVEDETTDPIVGKWFLAKVNSTDVTEVDCYSTSFIESDAKNITFFIQDRLEDGSCDTVLDNSQALTIQDGFYYIGNEAIEIYVDGNILTWRVDAQTSLEFMK